VENYFCSVGPRWERGGHQGVWSGKRVKLAVAGVRQFQDQGYEKKGGLNCGKELLANKGATDGWGKAAGDLLGENSDGAADTEEGGSRP